MIGVMVVVVDGLLLDLPPEVEEIVDGARKSKRASGVVPINLMGLLQKLLEERVVEV